MMLKWGGREGLDEFEARLDDRCIAGRGLMDIPGMTVIGRGGEPMIRAKKFNEVLPGILDEQWRKVMSVSAEMITEQLDELGSVLKRYDETVRTFRSAVKNDVASVKASAIATEDAVNRIGKVYRDTAEMLNTPAFKAAIDNAERMASALKAITELQSHSITFAVLDKKIQMSGS